MPLEWPRDCDCRSFRGSGCALPLPSPRLDDERAEDVATLVEPHSPEGGRRRTVPFVRLESLSGRGHEPLPRWRPADTDDACLPRVASEPDGGVRHGGEQQQRAQLRAERDLRRGSAHPMVRDDAVVDLVGGFLGRDPGSGRHTLDDAGYARLGGGPGEQRIDDRLRGVDDCVCRSRTTA